MNYYPIVVLYNTSIEESLTCCQLIEINLDSIHPVIVDNSDSDFGNKRLASERKWLYLSMGGNVGLSKAYNNALDNLQNNGLLDDSIVVLLDDDSRISLEFFRTLDSAVVNNPQVDIFCPAIRGQDGNFYSPNSYGLIKSHQIRSAEQEVPQRYFNAINSCTAVRGTVYKSYRYDERLFLDQVDHKFFEDQRKAGCVFMKIGITVEHNFSLQEDVSNVTGKRRRYELLVDDFLTFSSRSRIRMMLGYLKVFGWSIKETLLFRDPSWISWFLKQIYRWSSNGIRM